MRKTIKAAHLEIAKEIFLSQVKAFDSVTAFKMMHEEPKRLETSLGAVATFAWQAAEAFAYVYRVEGWDKEESEPLYRVLMKDGTEYKGKTFAEALALMNSGEWTDVLPDGKGGKNE
jgi:hypothetical protein